MFPLQRSDGHIDEHFKLMNSFTTEEIFSKSFEIFTF